MRFQKAHLLLLELQLVRYRPEFDLLLVGLSGALSLFLAHRPSICAFVPERRQAVCRSPPFSRHSAFSCSFGGRAADPPGFLRLPACRSLLISCRNSDNGARANRC